MIMQKTFRSVLAKDILRYIHLKQALGLRFEKRPAFCSRWTVFCLICANHLRI